MGGLSLFLHVVGGLLVVAGSLLVLYAQVSFYEAAEKGDDE